MLVETAAAWGDAGHEAVAQIAYARLAPATRARVDALLAGDNDPLTAPDFIARSTWADRYRDSDRSGDRVRYLQTRAWHFADIEIDGGSLGDACPEPPPGTGDRPASQGPADDCVVRKVDAFAAELADPATPLPEQRLALKFLIHFVGDLHQPLHTADRHDAGGNAVRVRWPGAATVGNLHGYWDTRLVRLLGSDAAGVAARVDATIGPEDAARWRGGSPAAWAIESHDAARTVAYDLGDQATVQEASAGAVVELDARYDARALPVVMRQLARAGVRLAALLDLVSKR